MVFSAKVYFYCLGYLMILYLVFLFTFFPEHLVLLELNNKSLVVCRISELIPPRPAFTKKQGGSEKVIRCDNLAGLMDLTFYLSFPILPVSLIAWYYCKNALFS